MAKVNVWDADPVTYPVFGFEIEGRGAVYTFWLKKRDAFDEANLERIYQNLCTKYLGPTLEYNKELRKVVKRGLPLEAFPPVGNRQVAISEELFSVAAGVAVMQDVEGHPGDIYDPEELIAIAARDPEVWRALLDKAGEINESPLGNASAEGAENSYGRLSSISTNTLN